MDMRHEKAEDLTGKKFGRLTVVSRAENYLYKCGCTKIKWNCRCECGNTLSVFTANLKSGITQSCGCLQRELLGNRMRTHGMTNSSLYVVWCDMKDRCYNTNNKEYKNYGGRGITICNEWKENFESFYEWSMKNGYKEEKSKSGRNILTIDRINNDGNYCPENCRWIKQKEQMKNTSKNNYIEYNGERKTLTDWAREYGIHRRTLSSRITTLGYTFEEAINKKDGIAKNSVVISHNGKDMSLSQYAREVGVHISLPSKDLARGMTVEEMKEHTQRIGEMNRKKSKKTEVE